MLIKIKNFSGAIYDRTATAKSAWDRGVARYALDILDTLEDGGIEEINPNSRDFEVICLNGASDWDAYSKGGCALIADYEIAGRLCTRSELKHKYHGNPNGKRPNAMEATWLDTQTRALKQAFALIQGMAITHARMKDATEAA